MVLPMTSVPEETVSRQSCQMQCQWLPALLPFMTYDVSDDGCIYCCIWSIHTGTGDTRMFYGQMGSQGGSAKEQRSWAGWWSG